MKTSILKIAVLSFIMSGGALSAQENAMREYLAPEKYQRNVFEDPKIEAPEYDGVKVSIGGDFAIQYQALKHETEANLPANVTLMNIGKNVNLPVANLDVNAYLAKGVKMHLRTYLSARHHNEAWVKGGYIQIDNLDFIKPGFLGNVMQYARVRVGMDDLNYGDAHFRRTDNAYSLNNPFVENNIMDSFTTQPFAEGYLFYNGFMGMLGVSNGKMNQTVVKNATSDNKPSFYAKVGYDKQVNADLRVRLTGSVIKTNGLTTNGKLYGDDRAGSHYYYVLLNSTDATGTSNPSTGRFNPGFYEMTAIQINPFIKYSGLEFFGTFERAAGYKVSNLNNVPTKKDSKGAYSQMAAELLYRFGGREQFYLGGKINGVTGKDFDEMDTRKIMRYNVAGGWYMTPNILAKLEYVNQKYDTSAAWGMTSPLYGGKFNGVVLEAAIGF